MLLNTRFYVDKALNRAKLYSLTKDWLSTSERFSFTLRDIDFDKEDDIQFESSDGLHKLIINNYEKRFAIQFIEESEDITTITNLVLDDVSDKPSLHLSQDKINSVMSVETKPQYPRIPSVIKTIFWNEFGGEDGDLSTQMDFTRVGKKNISWMMNILTGKQEYLLPILYVTVDNKSGVPAVDCYKLATDLMGQCHILVEASPLVGMAMKSLTSDISVIPYNGAVKLILPGGDSKVFTDKKEVSIINTVRRIMASAAIDDSFNITRLRQQHTFEKLSNSEDKELYDICQQMLNDKDAEIDSYKREISDLKKQLRSESTKSSALKDNLDSKTENIESAASLQFDGKEVYQGEIVDVVLKVLQKEYNSMKDDEDLSKSRKFDVLGDVLEHNFPCTTGIDLIECIKGAFKDGTLTRDGIGHLQSAGFVVEKRSAHYRIYYKGFDKYSLTVASTPSDKARGTKNGISDFCNVLFGY